MKADSHELVLHALTAWHTLRLLGYVDPGTGSRDYQLLIAVVTGVLVFFASAKNKIMSFFKRTGPAPEQPGTRPVKEPLAGQSKDETAALRN